MCILSAVERTNISCHWRHTSTSFLTHPICLVPSLLPPYNSGPNWHHHRPAFSRLWWCPTLLVISLILDNKAFQQISRNKIPRPFTLMRHTFPHKQATSRSHETTRCSDISMKKVLGETQTLRAGCSEAEPKFFALPQTSFPGAQDGQNLISWRWSLPSPTDPVWWRSMHTISRYYGNKATDRTDYNTLCR